MGSPPKARSCIRKKLEDYGLEGGWRLMAKAAFILRMIKAKYENIPGEILSNTISISSALHLSYIAEAKGFSYQFNIKNAIISPLK